jgi:hypothetical protein
MRRGPSYARDLSGERGLLRRSSEICRELRDFR